MQRREMERRWYRSTAVSWRPLLARPRGFLFDKVGLCHGNRTSGNPACEFAIHVARIYVDGIYVDGGYLDPWVGRWILGGWICSSTRRAGGASASSSTSRSGGRSRRAGCGRAGGGSFVAGLPVPVS